MSITEALEMSVIDAFLKLVSKFPCCYCLLTAYNLYLGMRCCFNKRAQLRDSPALSLGCQDEANDDGDAPGPVKKPVVTLALQTEEIVICRACCC